MPGSSPVSKSGVDRRALLTNVGWGVGLAIVTMALYRLIAFEAHADSLYDVRTSLDDAIPFVPWTCFLYSWVYTSMLYPIFVVRCTRLFRRVVFAYGAVIAVNLTSFALFPVDPGDFRPDISGLDLDVFHNWGVALTYFVDPPTNFLPSLHLSVATISGLAAWKARPLYGKVALPVIAAIAVSICTMKQHFVVDGVAALALASVAYVVFLRGYDRGEKTPEEVAYTWRGPVAYLAFHASVYLGLFVAFLADFRPWEG